MESNFFVRSTAFENGEMIPFEYTCNGSNISPPFEITGVGPNAKSIALIMDDPDAPSGMWVHWIKWNIPPTIREIEEGREPEGISGVGTSGNLVYTGPCPPDKVHRYIFKFYLLDTKLDLAEGSTKDDLEDAMEGHIIDQAEYVGRYQRFS